MSFLQSPMQPTFNSGRLDILETYYIIDTVNDTVVIGKATSTVTIAGSFSLGGHITLVTLTSSGLITADSLTITNHTTANTLTSTGLVTADSLTVTNHTSANTLTSTGLVTADSLTVTNHTSANTLTSTGLVTADSLTVTGDATFTAQKLIVPSSSPYNIGLGHSTLFNSISTGTYNTAFGGLIMRYCSSGDHNVGMGHLALNDLTTGSYNTGFGGYSMHEISTGSSNTGVGYEAGRNIKLGASGNTAVGAEAGTAAQDRVHTNCTFLGYKTGSGNANYSNSTAIGYEAVIDDDNQIMMGNTINPTDIQATGHYRGRYDGFDYTASFTGKAPIGTIISHNSSYFDCVEGVLTEYTGFNPLLDAGVWILSGFFKVDKNDGTSNVDDEVYENPSYIFLDWSGTHVDGSGPEANNRYFHKEDWNKDEINIPLPVFYFCATGNGTSKPVPRYRFNFHIPQTSLGADTDPILVLFQINAVKIA